MPSGTACLGSLDAHRFDTPLSDHGQMPVVDVPVIRRIAAARGGSHGRPFAPENLIARVMKICSWCTPASGAGDQPGGRPKSPFFFCRGHRTGDRQDLEDLDRVPVNLKPPSSRPS